MEISEHMVQKTKVSQSLGKITMVFFFVVVCLFCFVLFCLLFVCLFVVFFLVFLVDEEFFSDGDVSDFLGSDLGGHITSVEGRGFVVPWKDGKVSRDSTMCDKYHSFFWKGAECS